MVNDESRMTNDESMTKPEGRTVRGRGFEVRASGFFPHSSFVIRHSSFGFGISPPGFQSACLDSGRGITIAHDQFQAREADRVGVCVCVWEVRLSAGGRD